MPRFANIAPLMRCRTIALGIALSSRRARDSTKASICYGAYARIRINLIKSRRDPHPAAFPSNSGRECPRSPPAHIKFISHHNAQINFIIAAIRC